MCDIKMDAYWEINLQQAYGDRSGSFRVLQLQTESLGPLVYDSGHPAAKYEKWSKTEPGTRK
ncbi:hypothetical protein ANANG_G00137760 [Anguilla anguilla]|uniref:Uncharacterized protein n=1 Tax=Anguilla anguilla TaxID=7936 RepID=A0A9D3MDL2_ANGAN|nr:hypothetical protein ANANG_G00137760 [Anguilla anguilla]